MARQIQLRRGTAEQHEQFIGADGEVTVDTTNRTLRIHDGITPGGAILAKQSDISEMQQPVSACIPNYDTETVLANGTIYYADKNYIAIMARGSGANATIEVSRKSDMSNPVLLAEIYITSTGSIMFATPAIIPAGYYYRVKNASSTKIFPLG